MNRWKRLFYFLLLNALVSAGATLTVLTIWERNLRLESDEIAANALIGAGMPYNQNPTLPPPIATDVEIPAATAAIEIYQVQPGDTLGEIAQRFDVDVDDLAAYNGISDPNVLGTLETLFIPLPTAQLDNVDSNMAGGVSGTPLPTITPHDQGAASQAEIASVIGAGDLDSERVLIKSIGEGELSLTDWLLKDDDGNEYVFPQLILFKDGAVNLHSSVGVDTVVDLYWNQVEAIWDSGDVVTLQDPQGNVRATYQVP